jgi:hypothetical protein
MPHSMFRAARDAALLGLVALAAACTAGTGEDPDLNVAEDPSRTVFLTQATPPEVVMEALFEGRVYRDEQGCLRLESLGNERHTAVWPYGFTLESRDGKLYVKDAQGRSIGQVGGQFRLGGGEVPGAESADLTEEKRALARSRCPGRYWVVGDTDLRA